MPSLDDEDSERIARASRLAAGCREAARQALAFARRYRDEEGAAGGSRETACVLQALEWRRAAHAIRAGRSAPALPRPGLARASLAATKDRARAG